MISIGDILSQTAPTALRKERLRNKLARFLTCRAPDGAVEEFWTIQCCDDAQHAQQMFDRVDQWMRREGWDDKREWKQPPS